MKTKKTYFATAACVALTVLATGCSREWLTGGAPEVPPGAFIEDPETPFDPISVPVPEVLTPEEPVIPIVPEGTVTQEEILTAIPSSDESIPIIPDIRYTVQKNDTLSGIAHVYGVKTAELAKYNGIKEKSIITPGQVLLIPADEVTVKNAKPANEVTYSAAIAEAEAAAQKKEKKDLKPVKDEPVYTGKHVIHTVKKGDMLGKLAIAYGVRTADIAAVNHIDTNSMLRINQKLIIPDPKKQPSKTAPKKKAADTKPVAAETVKSAAAPAAAAAVVPAAEPVAEPVKQETTPAKPEAKDVPPANTDDMFSEAGLNEDGTVAVPGETVKTPAAETAAPEPAAAKPAAASGEGEYYKHELDFDSTIEEMAMAWGCTTDELLKLNPNYKLTDRLPKGSPIMLPVTPRSF